MAEVNSTDVLAQTIGELIKEQKKSRVVKMIMVLGFGAMFIFSTGLWRTWYADVKEHAALVQVHGAITSSSGANANALIRSLQRAFTDKKASIIVLEMDSPGGQVVQAGWVHDELERLKDLFPEKRVYAVIADSCMSACYWIASAAHEIYAHPASLVGSIGVKIESFGFDGVMERLGVERRVFTSGEHKAALDPFMPLQDSDAEYIKKALDGAYIAFVDDVKDGREGKLVVSDDLFSGAFWSGQQALKMGLIDGFESRRSLIEGTYDLDTTFDYSPNGRGKLGALLGYALDLVIQ